MAQLSEFQYYQKADKLLIESCHVLQSMFLEKWRSLKGQDWKAECFEELMKMYGRLLKPYQKKVMGMGCVENWDIPILARILVNFNISTDEDKAIRSILTVRNEMAHNAKKTLASFEYSEMEGELKANLRVLGVPEKEVKKMVEDAESKFLKEALEQATKLILEGDTKAEKKEFMKAVESYNEALQLPHLSQDLLRDIYIKRSQSYLSEANKVNRIRSNAYFIFAIKDAQKAIELDDQCWIGHHTLGLIYWNKSNADDAMPHFNRALAIDPGNSQVKNIMDACKFQALTLTTADRFNPKSLPQTMEESLQEFNSKWGKKLTYAAHDNAVNHTIKRKRGIGLSSPGHAYYCKGEKYKKGFGVKQDYEKAVECYKESAMLGDEDGYFSLAMMYLNGNGVEYNVAYAIELLNAGAKVPLEKRKRFPTDEFDNGAVQAQYLLGVLHEYGIGVKKDYGKAAFWYEKSHNEAEGAKTDAANLLAHLYSKGLGVEKDQKRAELLWKEAVEGKSMVAAHNLSTHYLVHGEPDKAMHYFDKAIKLGYEILKCRRQRMVERVEETASRRIKKEPDVLAFEAKHCLTPNGLTFLERWNRMNGIDDSRNEQIAYLGHVRNEADDRYCAEIYNKAIIERIAELTPRALEGSKKAISLLKGTESTFKLEKLLEAASASPSGDKVETEEIAETLYQVCLPMCGLLLHPKLCVMILEFLDEALKAHGKEKSELDKKLRFCYCLINEQFGNLEEFHVALLNEGVKRYPEIVEYHKLISVHYLKQKRFKLALEMAERGLGKFPYDCELCYFKAEAIGNVQPKKPISDIRKAFMNFVEMVHIDQANRPDGYYAISKTFLDEAEKMVGKAKEKCQKEARHYYKLGVDAEEDQLLFRKPTVRQLKQVLSVAMIKLEKELTRATPTQSSNDRGAITDIIRSKVEGHGDDKLSIIKEAREYIKKGEMGLFDIRVDGGKSALFGDKKGRVDSKEYKLPTKVTVLKEITFSEMTAKEDYIYEGRILTLTIIEKVSCWLPCTYLVGRDEKGDVARLLVYSRKDEGRKELCDKLRIGCRVSISHPFKIVGFDGTNGIRVEPKQIIYLGKVKNMCRYCGKENAQKRCSKCMKVVYCSQECQVADWKILKHSWICGVVHE